MKKLLFAIVVLVQAGCAFMLSYIKDKKPSATEKPEALAANEYMWDQIHQANYDSIPVILEKLNKAYALDPNDVKVTAHLGFVYLWAFSERIRDESKERMLENVLLSNRYFKEAIVLNPKDPRIHGFQAAVEMCEGALTNNLELLAKSYFKGLKAIRKWPQFNKFALGYVESQLDTGSRMYKQGLKYQWEIIDDCSEKKLTEELILENPTVVLSRLYEEIKNSKDPKIKRACGNSWIAPHNWEGFFLNFGDMLVKAGKPGKAKVMYEATRISPVFEEWAYKGLIDERIDGMNENLIAFNQKQNLIQLDGEKQLMINSEISCSGCHRMSRTEFEAAGYKEPLREIYFLADVSAR
jgi:hypothetical protein